MTIDKKIIGAGLGALAAVFLGSKMKVNKKPISLGAKAGVAAVGAIAGAFGLEKAATMVGNQQQQQQSTTPPYTY
ncbi:MAG: hypothetical protein HYX66_08975 [Ignavibacteria bacterium]|nr:hypothetical protein [Ignavibacteria bacterium]